MPTVAVLDVIREPCVRVRRHSRRGSPLNRPESRLSATDLVCFSHLRWDHVYQRPNHLMARASQDRRVWFVEEPDWEPGAARLERHEITADLTVIRPIVTPVIDRETLVALLNRLMRGLY